MSEKDSRVCHAPGERCLGCNHYYGKASVCSYAYTAKEAEENDIYFEMREAMQEFVNRCENGEVLSKYTYAKFKEILERAG